MKRLSIAVCLGVFLSVAVVNTSSSAEIVFRPGPGLNNGTDEGGATSGKDAYFGSCTSSADNFGDATYLYVSPISTCNSCNMKAFIQFDISSLPANVSHVYLGFTHLPQYNCYSNCSADFYFYPVSSSWNEMTVNLDNAPAHGSSIVGPIHLSVPNNLGNQEYDITGLYQQWKSGTTPNYGIEISSNTTGCNNGSVAFYVDSSDAVNESDRPYLRIVTTDPPTATTQSATNVGDASATLNGIVNANGNDATVTFEYGTDTSYGTSAAGDPSPVSGSTDTAVSAGITGLIPNTTYHFRVVAQNSAGTTNGNDMTFATEVDSDGDGVYDSIEGTGDRDGDGINNSLDYDPTGYFYDEATGKIIPGGQVSVAGPGAVTLIQDGSSGYYQFITDGTPGIYVISVTPPSGYDLSSQCGDQGTLDPTGQSNPFVLGNGEDGSSGFLTSNACTPYYLQLDLAPGDPVVFENNLPLRARKTPGIPSLSEWGMILFGLLLGSFAIWYLGKRSYEIPSPRQR